MINLLPPEQKKQVEKEYKYRLGSAYILLLSIAVMIGAILLLPSYFLVEARESLVQTELLELQGSSENSERESIREELLATKELLKELSKDDTRESLYSVIDRISSASNGVLEISTISYARAATGASSALSVGGVAPTRETLLTFKRALEADDLFEEIVLPVSSLAEDEDIRFSIQVKGPF